MAEKTERFGLVMSKKERGMLEELAKQEGETAAVVLRRLIREAAKALQASTDPGT